MEQGEEKSQVVIHFSRPIGFIDGRVVFSMGKSSAPVQSLFQISSTSKSGWFGKWIYSYVVLLFPFHVSFS